MEVSRGAACNEYGQRTYFLNAGPIYLCLHTPIFCECADIWGEYEHGRNLRRAYRVYLLRNPKVFGTREELVEFWR